MDCLRGRLARTKEAAMDSGDQLCGTDEPIRPGVDRVLYSCTPYLRIGMYVHISFYLRSTYRLFAIDD